MKLWIFCAAVALATPALAQEQRWPLSFEDGEGAKFTVYQPQLEKWDGARALFRAAVSVESTASPRPTFGAVWLVGRGTVDPASRLVTFERLAAPRASFPTAENADAWLATLRTHLPSGATRISLDRLESDRAAAQAARRGRAALGNEPPAIYFAEGPSLLVLVDGAPVLRRTGSSGLRRVINTRSLLLRDETSGHYFLAVGSRWLVASSLDGRFTVASSTPEGAEAARKAAEDADLHGALEGSLDTETPAVFASTRPAELIQTTGAPSFAPVEGTDLLALENSESHVLVDTNTNDYYVLASGRWFRAASREGPWTFVAGKDLPRDFARIPASSPAGEVLASVPGTPEAQEAALADQVPVTATVKKSEARLETAFDGSPRMEPIDGTNLSYALNSRVPVIRSGDYYYACKDGVWFVGPTPDGPWTVADSVDPEIYSIPPSCPVHYVVYVRVYDATPDWVFVGYTPGYFGSCYSWDDGCVVWGTGWWHRPWIGSFWIGCPWTYGFGCRRHCCHWGWSWNVGVCCPWWGPTYTRTVVYSAPLYAYGAVYTRWNAPSVSVPVASTFVRPPAPALVPAPGTTTATATATAGTFPRSTATTPPPAFATAPRPAPAPRPALATAPRPAPAPQPAPAPRPPRTAFSPPPRATVSPPPQPTFSPPPRATVSPPPRATFSPPPQPNSSPPPRATFSPPPQPTFSRPSAPSPTFRPQAPSRPSSTFQGSSGGSTRHHGR